MNGERHQAKLPAVSAVAAKRMYLSAGEIEQERCTDEDDFN